MSNWVPELLSPAGNFEKCKTAVLYGANAVYLAGLKFGLREASDNFTSLELKEAVEFCHQRNVLVYVVLNGFLHDSDLQELPSFLQEIEVLKVDAVIVSDLGVIEKVKEFTSIPIHLSTQASCLNAYSAMFWKNMGVTRVVLGRETSIQEAKSIKEATGLEVEMFIHGAMCMSYSGHCVISNYTQGRDSNRGGCAHSCRFEYSLHADADKLKNEAAKKSFFMSSKDLSGLRALEEFIKAGIDSLKVEGRNKSEHYAGTVTKVYAEALAFYRKHGHFLSDALMTWERELKKIPHRDYTDASLISPASDASIYHDREHEQSDTVVCGQVLETNQDRIYLSVKSAFSPGDKLEIIPIAGPNFTMIVDEIFDMALQKVERTKPGTLVSIKKMSNVEKFSLVRKSL